jgi:plastocyanin
VQIGNNFFKSAHNGTVNPAVDTIAVGGTVSWGWPGSLHSVESTGSPSFTSSPIQSSGTYSFTFNNAGTYSYTCAVHPGQMTGQIVVLSP